MFEFEEIWEIKDIARYLASRNLLKKYKKQKVFLLKRNFKIVDFKKRQPYSQEVFQFRIDKKFRAYCFLDGKILKVFHIDDHQ